MATTVTTNLTPAVSIVPTAVNAAPSTGCNCAACKQNALERVRYFPRQLLTVDDMVADQNYFREKLRRHNRYLHGSGVVCGLIVSAAPAAGAPWRVQVSEGYALGPYGDDIFVAGTVFLDLARCAAGDVTDPCDPATYNRMGGGAIRELFVGIQYAECRARPVRSIAAGCGCDDAGCEYSRIRDSFELGCMPPPVRTPPVSICDVLSGKAILTCPPDPASPWVVLAAVALPASTDTQVTDQNIVNSVRQYVFSTTMIQRQVIQCCCKPAATPPVQVTSVTPANQAALSAPPANITITFNKPLQPASVSAQSILVAGSNGVGVVAAAINYNAASNTVTFTPAAALAIGSYTVTAKGTGTAPVTDTDSLALDGKGSGTPGSDHVTTFSIVPVLK